MSTERFEDAASGMTGPGALGASGTCSGNTREYAGAKNRRILIVDTNAATRVDIRFLLEARGYEVIEARGGDEAIALASSRQPDLVLLGEAAGNRDEFETCRRLKATEALSEAPVIFLVSGDGSWNAAEGFLAGGSDYISKPIRVREAVSRIEKHLGVRSLLQSRRRQIAELDSLNRSKDRILRMASHDLRNSLGAIGDLAEMLGAGVFGPLNDGQKEMIDSITSAAEGVLHLLGDLQALSSIDPEAATRDFTWQRIGEVAQTTVRLSRGTATKKQIELSLSMKTEPPESLFDRNQIRRVIENFVNNAMKFSAPGGSVDVRISEIGTDVLVEVLDNGPGVPESEQDRLFREFGVTSARPTGGERCTGLGLFISRQIIAVHGGRIGMFNRPEGGACFYFTLPIRAN